jgi:drug/metabolite transporter (DMT)-like permease
LGIPSEVRLLLMCCALWGLGQVAAKVTLAEIPPLTQAALRSAGAALLVLAWMRWRRLPLALGDGTAPAGLLAGLLFAAEFACCSRIARFAGSFSFAICRR